MTTYGQTDSPPMFQNEGEQQVIRYVPQQQPQQQQQQQTYAQPIPQGYGVTTAPDPNYSNQPMVAQALPAQYPNYIPQGGFAVTAVPIGIVHPTRGMWSDGLCDCFNDCESCLLAWIIPPFLFARNIVRSALGEWGASFAMYFIPWLCVVIFYPLAGNGVIGAWGLIVAIIAFLFTAIIGCMFRGKLRQKYAIPGDQMEDMCMHCCCIVCALSQEARHVGRANQAANAPPQQMQMPMGVYAPQQFPQQQFPQQQFPQQQQQFTQPQQFQQQQFQPQFAQAPSGYPNQS